MTDGRRISAAQVERLQGLLGPRDWAVLYDLQRVKVLTGRQLDELHFHHVAASARGRVRRRSMARLRDWRLVTTLERRVGGVRAGSSGLIWTLDSGGHRALEHRRAAAGEAAARSRLRRPRTPRPLFLAHALAVSDLYSGVKQVIERTPGVTLDVFQAEPACWWPDGSGGWLKPDAYAGLATPEFIDHWWVEVDRATESLPTLRGKLLAYVAFVNRGGLGPGEVVPNIMVTVPDPARAEAVRRVVARLPGPGSELVTVAMHETADEQLVAGLRDGGMA